MIITSSSWATFLLEYIHFVYWRFVYWRFVSKPKGEARKEWCDFGILWRVDYLLRWPKERIDRRQSWGIGICQLLLYFDSTDGKSRLGMPWCADQINFIMRPACNRLISGIGGNGVLCADGFKREGRLCTASRKNVMHQGLSRIEGIKSRRELEHVIEWLAPMV